MAIPTSTVSPAHGLANEVLGRCAKIVSPAIDTAIDRLMPELRPPVQHHMAGGGKRVRAALVLVTSAATGGSDETGMPGAVAIELVHNFSLIHDDIIDGDQNRRHRPTVWSLFGVGRAIVAGDALAALATQVLLDDPTPERVLAAASLTTATQLMIAGQADDMAFESRSRVSLEECLGMAAGKTGALLSSACSLGAILSGAPESTIEAMADFGQHLGIAFQAIDDVLGIWGNPSQTGKSVENDLVQSKKTLPVVAALANAGAEQENLEVLLANVRSEADIEQATQLIEEYGGRTVAMGLAESHLDSALAVLASADLTAEPRAQLEAIAQFITERDR